MAVMDLHASKATGLVARVTECTTKLWTYTASGIDRWIWSSGITCAVIANFISASNGLLVKIIVLRVPVFEIVVLRGLSCTLVSVAVQLGLGCKASNWYGRRANYRYLVIRGVLGALAMSADYFGLQYLAFGDAITIVFSNPAIISLLAWMLLREAMGWLGIAGLLASMLGVAAVAQPPMLFGTSDWSADHLLGVGMALTAATFIACAFMAIKFMSTGESALSIALWYHTASVIVGAVPLAVGKPAWPLVPSWVDATAIFFIAATSFVGQLVISRAFQLGPTFQVSVLSYTQVVYAHILGILLLNDRLTIASILGAALIALGMLLANFKKLPRRQTKAAELPVAVQLPVFASNKQSRQAASNGHDAEDNAELEHMSSTDEEAQTLLERKHEGSTA